MKGYFSGLSWIKWTKKIEPEIPGKTLSLESAISSHFTTMKRFATYILILLPCITFGQLFPNVQDFKGHVAKVVEKKYGREVNYFLIFKGIYRPRTYSGWKCTYLFDEKSNLIQRTNSIQGRIKADYLYQHDTIGNRIIKREIMSDNTNGHQGDYIEYENFINSAGQIEKVNFWAFDAKACSRELFQIEQNAEYKENRLISFTRHVINENGKPGDVEKCHLFYDSLGKLIRIERVDMASGFKTAISYSYNDNGMVINYGIDFLVELQEYGKDQIQEIIYNYDKQGNWTKMYWKSGNKNRLDSKREIYYY